MADSLVLDELRREVRLDGEPISVSWSEFEFLAALMRYPGAAVSSADLLVLLRGPQWAADVQVLQVLVSRLRRKLRESAAQPRFVVTIYGFGYRFEPEPRDGSGMDEDAGDDPVDRPIGSGPAHALMSMDRTIAWASEGMRDLLGWEPQALVGMSLYDLAPSGDRPDWVKAGAGLNAGAPRAFTGPTRRGDGTFRSLNACVRPVVDAGGTVTGFLAEWSTAEQAPTVADVGVIQLTPSGRLARRVGLWLDREFILRTVTPPESFLGWEPDEIIGTYFSPTGLDAATIAAIVESRIRLGILDFGGPINVHARDGSVVPAMVSTRIEMDSAGALAGLSVTLTLEQADPEAT